MTTNPIPLILLFTAIGFLIGAAVGYFAFKYEEGRKAAPKQAEAEAPDPRKQFLVEQVSLWRERAGSRLVVWLEGKPLNSPQSLDAGHRKQLESAGLEFLAWLEVQPALAEVSEKAVVEERLDQITAASAPPAPHPQPVAPSAIPAPAVEAAKPVGPAKPLTIVEQIDEILQELLKQNPTLAARAIRLLEDPREGAVVWVGLEHFNGVDTVPYPEIKAVLRQAAGEWERRTERSRR